MRRARPREPVAEPVRFETPPRRQGQVDVDTFRSSWGPRRHALLAVLGYSRLLWLLRFYARQTMAVLLEGTGERLQQLRRRSPGVAVRSDALGGGLG